MPENKPQTNEVEDLRNQVTELTKKLAEATATAEQYKQSAINAKTLLHQIVEGL